MFRSISLRALLGGAIVFVSAVTSANAGTLDELTNWVGTGANRSALVIDFNDGATPASVAWGYRWDGAAPSAEAMFLDVVRADPRLYAKVGTAGAYGTPIFGVGYDANAANAFAITTAGAFDANGVAVVSSGTSSNPGPVDGGVASFAGDRYAEGWWSGNFWGHFQSASDPYAAGNAWGDGFGLNTQTIADGSFTGLSFGGWPSSAPDNPVPEPTAIAALAAAALVGTRRRRA